MVQMDYQEAGTQSLNSATPGGTATLNSAGGRPQKPKLIKGWAKNVGGRVFKALGKAGLKVASTGGKIVSSITGAGFGAIGGAIKGAIKGKPIQEMLTGMAMGGLAGWKIGEIPENLVKSAPEMYNSLTGWVKDKQYNINKDLFGVSHANQVRHQQDDRAAYRKFAKNEFQKDRAEEILSKIDPKLGLSTDDVLQQTYQYSKYGVSDDAAAAMIAREANKTGGLGVDQTAHARYLTAAVKGEAYKSDFFLDDKKVESLRKSLTLELGEDNANAVMYEMARAKGHGQLERQRQNQAIAQQRAAQQRIAQQRFATFSNNKDNIERAKRIQDRSKVDKDGNAIYNQADALQALYAYEQAGVNGDVAEKALGHLSKDGKLDSNSEEYKNMMEAATVMSNDKISEKDKKEMFSDYDTNAKVYEDLSRIVGTEKAENIMKDMSAIHGKKSNDFERTMRERTARRRRVEEKLKKEENKNNSSTGGATLSAGNPTGGNKPPSGSNKPVKNQSQQKVTKKQQREIQKRLIKQYNKEQRKLGRSKRKKTAEQLKNAVDSKKQLSTLQRKRKEAATKARIQATRNMMAAGRSGDKNRRESAAEDYKAIRMQNRAEMDKFKNNNNI